MLKKANQVARLSGSNNTLSPKAGEALVVRDIINNDVAASGWLTVRSGRATVHYLPVQPPDLSVLGSGHGDDVNRSIFRIAAEHGVDMSIPVQEGDSLTLSLSAGTLDCYVIYDIFDAADVKPDQDNGPESRVMHTALWGTHGTAFASGGDTQAFDVCLNPDEFSNFPFENNVPDGRKILLHALLASPFQYASSGVALQYSTHLILRHNRETLLTDESAGVGFDGGDCSITGTQVHYDPSASWVGFGAAEQRGKPYFFDPALEFDAGDELSIQVTTASLSAGDIPAESVVIGFLATIQPAK